jgi:predicted CXXCH cytochrome family protein
MEPNMVPVPNGTVVLVPASDVEALSQMPIDIFASPEETAMQAVDEPIEDLLDANGDTYEQVAVENGEYRFETLPEGSHFIVWVPAADDAEHLPGGDSSRVSFDTASLVGMQMDIHVSSQPSESATYVGSSTCMVCHGLQSTARTAHMVGLQVPGVRSIMQDIEPWPDFDEALAKFGSTTLFYYDCGSGTSNPAKCKIGDPDEPQPANTSFEITLRRDSSKPLGVAGRCFGDPDGQDCGTYSVRVENVAGSEPALNYSVVLTYGGALGKQQYLTRRSNADGSFSYFVLPLQYNYEGDFDNGTEVGDGTSDDWPWRDYRSDLWYDFNTNMLRNPDLAPIPEESFDNNCAGCHMTGYELRGSEADVWAARAVVDPGGAFDYDGDDRVELINVGCEACHGPGSEHLERSPRSSYIVSPGLLTPGRQAMLCGSCHSRPLGIGGGEKGLPLSEDNEMPPPGIRRAAFAVHHTTRVSGDPDEDFFSSGDAFGNYQQYSDHIRSTHYRNASRLVTCTGCHSPHANDADIAATDTSGNPNALCTTCHAEIEPVTEHIAFVTGVNNHDSLGPFLCIECHMVTTAKSGAAVPALLDTLTNDDTEPRWQYYWNDVASHRMTVTPWTDFAGRPDQPIAFTNECGFCHGAFLPNTPP